MPMATVEGRYRCYVLLRKMKLEPQQGQGDHQHWLLRDADG